MGLISKIKDILFEDEGEEATTDNMPVFTKEDSVAAKKEEAETVSFDDEDDDEPLKVTTGSRFKNDKRDIELDDADFFGDEKKEEEPKEEELPISKLEDSSPILPFDEDEFDRINARLNNREEKVERSVREVYQEKETLFRNVDARKANSNFSSTDAPERSYEGRTIEPSGERKFTPSPVISPVYGILDKNYKKEEIVDRVGGLKREKKVSKPKEEVKEEIVEEVKVEEVKPVPPIIEETPVVDEEPIKVDLDSVREKAFGSIDNLLEEALEEVKVKNEVKEEPKEESVEIKEEVPVVEEVEEEGTPLLDIPEVEEEIKEEENHEEKMIEDILDEEPPAIEEPKKEDVSDLILQDMDEPKEEKKEETKSLDDVEKTSTLKILDDIEKELNDIEPVSKKNNLENTLENDLFNLIDSMYEKGEDE